MPKHVLIDLDAASLLADATHTNAQPRARTVAPVADRVRTVPTVVMKRPGAVLRPTAKKSRRDAGRDEMLSDYLSSLGRIKLLGPDDEKELAARFRDAEVRCWIALLQIESV